LDWPTRKGMRLLFCILIWLLSFSTSLAQTGTNFDHLLDNGGFIVKDGSGNLRHRETETFIPASTLKILTSLAALEILGEDYRFETHFFLDNQRNLYVKGYGDPFLTSQVLQIIAEKLYSRGVRHLLSVRLDESSYTVNSLADGADQSSNPFDAPNGALAVNFNSVPIIVFPDGSITSGETETPDIPIMHEIGRSLDPGTHRVNINTLQEKGTLSPSLRYTGELITAFFNRAGITIENGIKAGRTPERLPVLYIHSSEKSMRDIVRACLKYSNNYIANQLFLACGAGTYGLPANWNKSRRLFKVYIKERLQLSTKEFSLVEGSGLSRKNVISPAGLLKAVEHFRPYADLLNFKGNSYLKSGTLTDVFCYAGFLIDHDRYLPFVIMLNQQENNRDKLLTALHHAINENIKQSAGQ